MGVCTFRKSSFVSNTASSRPGEILANSCLCQHAVSGRVEFGLATWLILRLAIEQQYGQLIEAPPPIREPFLVLSTHEVAPYWLGPKHVALVLTAKFPVSIISLPASEMSSVRTTHMSPCSGLLKGLYLASQPAIHVA